MDSSGVVFLFALLGLIVWWLFFRTPAVNDVQSVNKPNLLPPLSDIAPQGMAVKKQNLLPPLSDAPIQGPADAQLGPGWTGVTGYEQNNWTGGTRRVKTTDMPGVPNPSTDPFYFRLTYNHDILTASAANLVLGRSYQLSGYIHWGVTSESYTGEMTIYMDVTVLFNKQYTPSTQFVRFGPITIQATAKTHKVKFYNSSKNTSTTKPVGAYRAIVRPLTLTGLLLE